MSDPRSARKPTLEDVAQVAGVSRATVSRVINNTRNVDPRSTRWCGGRSAETGYVPNRAARSLVTRRTGTIALVVSDAASHDDDPFMSRLLRRPVLRPGRRRADQRAAPAGHPAGAAARRHRRRPATGWSATCARARPTAPSCCRCTRDDTLPRLLVEAGLPAVLVGRPAQPMPISYVDLANDAGAALAAEHLVGPRLPADRA